MAYLNGEKQNNSAILGFAKKLALALGYEETYFLTSNYRILVNESYSSLPSAYMNLSPKGKENFKHILRICDLIDIYSLEAEKG